MPAPKVMSGGRAKVNLTSKGISKVVGIFTDISYGYNLTAQPVYILGSHIAQEIVYTSAEVVNITASGWRAFGFGRHQAGGAPTISEMLTSEYLTFDIYDRAQGDGDGTKIATISQVRFVSSSEGFSTGQLSTVTFHYMGVLVDDEYNLSADSQRNAESANAAVLIPKA